MHRVINQGDTVIDIGAHKAAYLYFMAQLTGTTGKVYAIEPQSTLYKYVARIKEVFCWNHVTVEHLALSDTAGSAQLFVPVNKSDQTSSPGASIVTPQPGKEIMHTETVRTDTLDAYCQKHQIVPKFIKIDVEGNELNVFKGGRETLTVHKPKILVEIEARHIGIAQAEQTFEFLIMLGYNGSFIKGIDLLPLSEFQFDIHQNLSNMAAYCNNFVFE